MRKGRGRARYMPTERWESPPHDLRDPGNFDIARGKIFHRDPNSRIRPLMSGDPHLGLRVSFKIFKSLKVGSTFLFLNVNDTRQNEIKLLL